MSKNKTVLGKGLGALIPGMSSVANTDDASERGREPAKSERTRGDELELPIASITANPFQPRKDFPEAELIDLSESIRQHGVIQPITVRKIGENRYQLIAGERRLRASERAGLRSIPAYIKDVDNDRTMLELSIIENVQRQDLNPIEEAESYKRLIDECGLRQEDVAARIGKDRATISNFLRLLRLPNEIKHSLREGKLGMGHAKAVMLIDEQEHILRLWKRAIDEGLSVRKLEELARSTANDIAVTTGKPLRKKTGRPMKLSTGSTEVVGMYAPIETRLKQTLATQVRIRPRSGDGGEIAIEFYSNDDLDRLTDLLLTVTAE